MQKFFFFNKWLGLLLLNVAEHFYLSSFFLLTLQARKHSQDSQKYTAIPHTDLDIKGKSKSRHLDEHCKNNNNIIILNIIGSHQVTE